MDYDFSAIAASGVSQQEFAELAGVSRVTVNKYVTGKTAVSRLNAASVKRALAILKVCMKLNSLPGNLPARSRHYTEQRKLVLSQAFEQAEDAIEAHKARRARG